MDALIRAYASSVDSPGLENELEFRFDPISKAPLTRQNYNYVVRALSGLGFKASNEERLLRIYASTCRVEIAGSLTIQAYCDRDILDASTVFIKKKKVHVLPPNAYGMKGSLSTEIALGQEDADELRKVWATEPKRFRLLSRVTFTHCDYPFKVDCSVVKMSDVAGTRFSTSDVFHRAEVFEVEVEATHRPTTPDYGEKLRKLLTVVVGALQGTPFPVSHAQIGTALAEYYKLTRADMSKPAALRFLGPNTVTLQRPNLRKVKRPKSVLAEEEEPSFEDNTNSIHNNYLVTDKTDGMRKMLFIQKNGDAYFLPSKMEVAEFTGAQFKSLPGTLLDGEFVEHDKDGRPLNMFAVFDVYFFKGKDVRAEPLEPTRRSLMKEIVTALDGFTYTVIAKTFYKSDRSIFEACRECLKADVPYRTDGLIFTPAERGVGLTDTAIELATSTITWPENFKWKPEDQNTIDFKVQKNDNLWTVQIVGTSQNWDKPYEALLKQDTPCPRTKRGLRAFITEEDPTSQYMSMTTTEEGDRIEDGMVVECRYDVSRSHYDRWVPVRVRWDKEQPNSFVTALNNWNVIQNPVALEEITGEWSSDDPRYYVGNKTAMKAVRSFHRFVKEHALKLATKRGDSLFDFAVGQGGDLHSWRKLGLAFVFGIDLSGDNLHNKMSGAITRYLSTTRINSSLMLLVAEGDMTKSILKGAATPKELDNLATQAVLGRIPKKDIEAYPNLTSHYGTKFQVAACMFALHYAFKDADSVNQFVENVSDVLETGGHLVGCCWDGSTVFELLKGQPQGGVVTLDDVTITKGYNADEFDPDESSVGMAIQVSQSTFNSATEWLVHFDYLETVLLKAGFHKVAIEPFSKVYAEYERMAELSDVEKKLSFLNKLFVFKKTAHK
jgi:SAM-dependent methyltransferase